MGIIQNPTLLTHFSKKEGSHSSGYEEICLLVYNAVLQNHADKRTLMMIQ
jgi:hypothetical protein